MEIKLTGNSPLVKLPQEIDLTLFLIREELKNKKFTNDLEIKDKIHQLEMKLNNVKPTDSHIECVGCGS